MLDPQVLCTLFSFFLLLSAHRLKEFKVKHLLPGNLREASISPLYESCLNVSLVEFYQLVFDLSLHVYLKISVQSSPVVKVAIELLTQHFTY